MSKRKADTTNPSVPAEPNPGPASTPSEESLDDINIRMRTRLKCGQPVLVDYITLGEARQFPIYSTFAKPMKRDRPTLCPNAEPKVPEGLLPAIQERFRELQLIGKDESLHWVGRQATIDTLCTCSSPGSASVSSQDSQAPAPPVWLGGKSFFVDGKHVSLGYSEAKVAETFAVHQRAMGAEELKKLSGIGDPVKTLKSLLKKAGWMHFGRLPKKKGTGYFLHIRDGRENLPETSQ